MLYSNPTIYKYIRFPIYAKGGIGVHLKSFSLRWALVPLFNLAKRDCLGGGGGGWAQRSQATRCSMYNMSHLLDAVVLDAVCIHPGLLDIILDVVVLYVV